jgi:hypothetical protein
LPLNKGIQQQIENLVSCGTTVTGVLIRHSRLLPHHKKTENLADAGKHVGVKVAAELAEKFKIHAGRANEGP